MYANVSVLEYNLDFLLSTKTIKDYLRIDDNFDDDLLLLYIKTAEVAAENIIGDYLSEKTIEVIFELQNGLYLDLSNFKISKLIDVLDLNSNKIIYDYNPASKKLNIKGITGDFVKVVCKVGYNFTRISHDLRFAVLNHIGYIYQNKGGDVSFIPQSSLDVYFSRRKSFKL